MIPKTRTALLRLLGCAVTILSAIETSSAGPLAYVLGPQSIAVIDAPTGSQITTIPVVGGFAIDVDPHRPRAYVVGNGGVFVIDTRAHVVVGTIADSGQGIAFNSARNEAYLPREIACSPLPPFGCTTGETHVVNTETLTKVGTVSQINANHVAFSPDGALAFFSALSSVSIWNTATRSFLASVPIVGMAGALVVDASARYVYVASRYGQLWSQPNAVTVIDIASRAAVARIPVGNNPARLVVDPKRPRLYVGLADGGGISVVDTDRLSLLTTKLGLAAVGGLDITPAGDKLLALDTNYYDFDAASSTWRLVSRLQIIDPESLQSTSTLSTLPLPSRADGHFIVADYPAVEPDAMSGLWWNPAESGWGVHLVRRGGNVFAVWFSYSASGAPTWYIASNCVMADRTCSGKLYSVTGTPYYGTRPASAGTTLREIGQLQIVFTDDNHGRMSYAIEGATRTMDVQPLVFRVGAASGVNYTDLWWNPAESGWGMGITHQGDTMFLTWFAYGASGEPVWYTASNCAVDAAGSGCSGTLYQTSGPANATASASFDRSSVNRNVVGTVTVTFVNANSGLMTYTVDGVSGSKGLVRLLF